MASVASQPGAVQSEHRTLNIEEADFYYMPIYVNLFVWPVFGWGDGPWWGGIMGGPQAPTLTLH